MSTGSRRRLESLERMVAQHSGHLHERAIGRCLRRIAEEDGIDCWEASEDATWRSWARDYGDDELRELLEFFHDAVTARAEQLGLAVSAAQRINPWRQEREAS